MTQEQINEVLKAQEAQYKALGMDKNTIKMMLQQMEASYKMMYGNATSGTNTNNTNPFANPFANMEDLDMAMGSEEDDDDADYENHLSNKQKFLVGCGLILADMNGEDTHTLAAGDEDASATKLENWWNLYSKKDVLEKINLVVSEGHRHEFQNSINTPQTKKIIKQIASIVKEYKINVPSEIAAWDFCRVIGLCRWAIDVKYFTEQEAENIMTDMAKVLQKTYASWQEMGTAYLLGRAWWSGEDDIMNEMGFLNAYNSFTSIIEDEDSYWNTIKWNTKL